jgi:N-formylglutamate amidohydrolase
METYYYPHHEKLAAAVESCINAFGYCLIDVHSFSSTPLPHEGDQSTKRAEICIGFDAFHCPFPGTFGPPATGSGSVAA